MMESDVIEGYAKAGAVLSDLLLKHSRGISQGTSILDVCERIEHEILEAGCKPAFPVNFSVNSVAAHYTAKPGDGLRVEGLALVKLDVGVHYDGYIADAAVSVCVDGYGLELKEACESALEKALSRVREGTRVREISSVIDEEIRRLGAKPISNLTGHMIGRYKLHAGVSIPNVKSWSPLYRLKTGDVLAIEPFATFPDAAGVVVEQPPAQIFSLARRRKPRGRVEAAILSYASELKGLPFCRRWVKGRLGAMYAAELDRLARIGVLRAYPPLLEASGAPVAQAEATVVVDGDGAHVVAAPFRW
ncbi:MAG: type II methionyl aminopeptidase [Thermoproteota archaeon]|nr:MAG: type II methionyl aminopeptidase [Candidatus Korarchaeota archaeon]